MQFPEDFILTAGGRPKAVVDFWTQAGLWQYVGTPSTQHAPDSAFPQSQGHQICHPRGTAGEKGEKDIRGGEEKQQGARGHSGSTCQRVSSSNAEAETNAEDRAGAEGAFQASRDQAWKGRTQTTEGPATTLLDGGEEKEGGATANESCQEVGGRSGGQDVGFLQPRLSCDTFPTSGGREKDTGFHAFAAGAAESRHRTGLGRHTVQLESCSSWGVEFPKGGSNPPAAAEAWYIGDASDEENVLSDDPHVREKRQQEGEENGRVRISVSAPKQDVGWEDGREDVSGLDAALRNNQRKTGTGAQVENVLSDVPHSRGEENSHQSKSEGHRWRGDEAQGKTSEDSCFEEEACGEAFASNGKGAGDAGSGGARSALAPGPAQHKPPPKPNECQQGSEENGGVRIPSLVPNQDPNKSEEDDCGGTVAQIENVPSKSPYTHGNHQQDGEEDGQVRTPDFVPKLIQSNCQKKGEENGRFRNPSLVPNQDPNKDRQQDGEEDGQDRISKFVPNQTRSKRQQEGEENGRFHKSNSVPNQNPNKDGQRSESEGHFWKDGEEDDCGGTVAQIENVLSKSPRTRENYQQDGEEDGQVRIPDSVPKLIQSSRQQKGEENGHVRDARFVPNHEQKLLEFANEALKTDRDCKHAAPKESADVNPASLGSGAKPNKKRLPRKQRLKEAEILKNDRDCNTGGPDPDIVLEDGREDDAGLDAALENDQGKTGTGAQVENVLSELPHEKEKRLYQILCELQTFGAPTAAVEAALKKIAEAKAGRL